MAGTRSAATATTSPSPPRLDEALADPRPSLIACRTIIGNGAPNKQGTAATHGAALGADEVAAARDDLGWDHPPFEIPDDILAAWRAAGQRGASAPCGLAGAASTRAAQSAEFTRRMAGELPSGFSLGDHIRGADRESAEGRDAARRPSWRSSAINAAVARDDRRLGRPHRFEQHQNQGAEASDHETIIPAAIIYYGIREFGMAAAMNGMALHGGVIPYGGTFLIFTDYARPAIRLSALQQVRVVYVMTHDSIGLGEDGPTHQPVEHLMSLRAMPNLDVYRPADAVETAECWELALRQADDAFGAGADPPEPAAGPDRGCRREPLRARRLSPARRRTPARKVVLIATGSEVALALEVADALEGQGIGADVVSMPCWSCSTRRTRPIAPTSSPTTRCSSRSRPARRWAGSAIPAATASISASTASAPRPRPRICSSISASPPRRSCRGYSRHWQLQEI